MTMQFDVYQNPATNVRGSYPYLVVLQSNVSTNLSDVIVAPAVTGARMSGSAQRLIPIVRWDDHELAVVVALLTNVPIRGLKRKLANVAQFRAELLGAVDLLFFGA